MITLTDNAAAKLRGLLEQQSPRPLGFRLAFRRGNLETYDHLALMYEFTRGLFDEAFEIHELVFMVDRATLSQTSCLRIDSLADCKSFLLDTETGYFARELWLERDNLAEAMPPDTVVNRGAVNSIALVSWSSVVRGATDLRPLVLFFDKVVVDFDRFDGPDEMRRQAQPTLDYLYQQRYILPYHTIPGLVLWWEEHRDLADDFLSKFEHLMPKPRKSHRRPPSGAGPRAKSDRRAIVEPDPRFFRQVFSDSWPAQEAVRGSRLEAISRAFSNLSEIEACPIHSRDFADMLLRADPGYKNPLPVLRVALQNLPLPSGDTAWEEVLEFKQACAEAGTITRFRRWIRSFGEKARSAAETKDEIDYLTHEYEAKMKAARIKVDSGILETFVTTTLEIAQHGSR
jgi:hypothetical protein